jgi:glycosyltransferase involved in cell wall biosynthesis
MKILWISHGSTLEGAERSLFEATKQLTDRGEEICVVIPSEGKLATKLQETTASTYVLETPWWVKEFKGKASSVKRVYEYAKAVFKLLRLLRQLQPDVVVTNTTVIPCGAVASNLLGIPHVWYIREFLEEDHGWSFEFNRRFSLSCINFLSTRVIVNSQTVYKKFCNYIPTEKLKVVYNAVEVNQHVSETTSIRKNADTFYAVLIGRKSPGKGQKEAIEAISILAKAGQKAHLWLVGSEFDRYTKDLKSYAKQLEIEQAVDFIPFVENPAQYVMAADVVLVCSRCEAFGRVTVEAMKFGRAVIGSDSGSTPELIQNGWNGLLYEASSVNDLADKIQALAKDQDLRKQLETNAFQWATHTFTPENYSADLMNVFREVTR